MSRILAVGDIHIPFNHKDYLKHCLKMYKKHKCNKVVFMGDVVDNHAISYHESENDGGSRDRPETGLTRWLENASLGTGANTRRSRL